MAFDCAKITEGLVAANCAVQTTPGTGTKIYLINYADINRSQSTVEAQVLSTGIIADLVLNSGKVAFSFETIDNSTDGEFAIAKGTYYSPVDHTITARVFTKSVTAKQWLNSTLRPRVVAILENKETGAQGECKYEVYGWFSGLELTELKGTTKVADGVYAEFKLASGKDSKEPCLPVSLFDTDLATTETLVTALTTAL